MGGDDWEVCVGEMTRRFVWGKYGWDIGVGEMTSGRIGVGEMTGRVSVGEMTSERVGACEMTERVGVGEMTGRNMRVVVWGNDQGYWCGGDVWWGEA